MTYLLVAVFVLAVLFFGGTYWAYRFTFYSPNATQNNDHTLPLSPELEPLAENAHRMIDELAAVPYEPVFITSHDGLRLRGRYYHQRDGAPIALCFHGYRGTPTRDFSGGSRVLARAGFNFLLIEERAHCGSEGHTISFGVNERLDCIAWVQHFHYRFEDAEMLLVGVSMGAATVLMSAALPLPDCVKGIVADCPFTEPKAIICKVGRDLHIPNFVTGVVAPVAARVFGRFRLNGASALEAVRGTKKPILLIHGENDTFVPCDMSRALHAVNPEYTELHTFPGANHGISYLVDPVRYGRLVLRFADRVLGASKELLRQRETTITAICSICRARRCRGIRPCPCASERRSSRHLPRLRAFMTRLKRPAALLNRRGRRPKRKPGSAAASASCEL